MERPYFVMIYSKDEGKMFALVNENDLAISFATREEAEDYAKKYTYAPYLGYKIFNMNE